MVFSGEKSRRRTNAINRTYKQFLTSRNSAASAFRTQLMHNHSHISSRMKAFKRVKELQAEFDKTNIRGCLVFDWREGDSKDGNAVCLSFWLDNGDSV